MHSSRRSPSLSEQAISAGVLAVLVVVVAGVLVQQRRFSPAVQVAGSLARAPAGPAAVLASWPAGLSPMGAAEEFPAATLSDKIDGKADLYLSAGFVRLLSQRVRLGASADSWIEMLVYDMGQPANAFSVWSSQKRPEAAEADLADYAYRAGNEVCLVHGNYYVELVATDTREATLRASDALARAFVAGTAVAAHANMSAEQELFPREGLVAGSVTLVPADVFGSDRLKSVFIARYRDGPEEVTLFAARRATPADATREAVELLQFLVQECGGKTVPRALTPASVDFAIVDLGGSFDAVLAKGRFLAGVHQAGSLETAQRWARIWQERLPGAKP